MSQSVAVLGTGIMGAGMARSLLREGFDVSVWNRTLEKAKPLAKDGARVAGSAAEAVVGADVVVTMLFDVDATVEVMEAALPHAPDGVVWLQAGTVGIDGIRRLGDLAERHGVGMLDAPVLGTKAPAENGQLIVLASGPSSLAEPVRPVCDAIGARTQWVSERIGDGTRLKLVANAWVGTVVHGIAQSVALADGLGIDPQQFLDAVSGGALDAPYVQLKGKAMIDGDATPSFELDGLAKDLDLIVAALGDAGANPGLAAALRERTAAASTAGHGAEDMSAVVHAYRA